MNQLSITSAIANCEWAKERIVRSDIPFHGGYLPGFEIKSQFSLIYSPITAQFSQSDEPQYSLHSPGERTPISGQYEVINSNGKFNIVKYQCPASTSF